RSLRGRQLACTTFGRRENCELLHPKCLLASASRPVWDECALDGSSGRIFVDPLAWSEKPAYVIDIILAGSRNNCSTDAHINFGQRSYIRLEVFHYLGLLGDNEKVARFAHYLCHLQS